MSQSHDDKTKTAASMESANPRPRARRPDMQLYIPRAMRRDSLDSSSTPSDKAVCVENPTESFPLQKNVEATNNKKHRTKKSVHTVESPNNNNIGDNSQKQRKQRTSPKNNAIQSAAPQLLDPVVSKTEVSQYKNDDKVKKSVKKTKCNTKPTLSANSPSNGEVGLVHDVSGDHKHTPVPQEKALGLSCAYAADCCDSKATLTEAEDIAIRETSQRLTTTQHPSTIHQENHLLAEDVAAVCVVSAPGCEPEILPNAKYSCGDCVSLSQEPTHSCASGEFEVDIPIAVVTNKGLDSSCFKDKPTSEFNDECSTSVKCCNAEDSCDAMFLSADSECGVRPHLKLEDQVKMLSRCDVSELAKLGCESIEMFLKESAVLISELDNTSTTACKEPMRLNVSKESDTCIAGHSLEPKPIGTCPPDQTNTCDERILLPPEDDGSSCSKSSTAESVLADNVSLRQEEIPSCHNKIVETSMPLHSVSLPSVDNNSSCTAHDEADAVAGRGMPQEKSAAVCKEAIGANDKSVIVDYIVRLSEETDMTITSHNLITENSFTSNFSICVLSPEKNDSVSIKSNNAVDSPTCKPLLQPDRMAIDSDELLDVAIADPAKVDDLCPPTKSKDKEDEVGCVSSSIQTSSPLPSELGPTSLTNVETHNVPNEDLSCQSKFYQTADVNVVETEFSEKDSVRCVSLILGDESNIVKAKSSQLRRGSGSVPTEKVASRGADLSNISTQDIATSKVDCTSDSSFTDADISLQNGEDSWEAMYDETGECLNPDLMKELTITVGKKIKVRRPKIDYTKFQPKEPQISDNEFGHVIEIYDFPVEFKTQDLMAGFAQFQNRGFDIKWVDDTHALGLFASPMAAADALNSFNPMFKTRPLSQATRESKVKAKRCAEFLQPYRPRPETSASLARRLVSGALGLQVRIPKEQRELERQKLREAKEKRKLAAKQKVDVWEGIVANPP